MNSYSRAGFPQGNSYSKAGFPQGNSPSREGFPQGNSHSISGFPQGISHSIPPNLRTRLPGKGLLRGKHNSIIPVFDDFSFFEKMQMGKVFSVRYTNKEYSRCVDGISF